MYASRLHCNTTFGMRWRQERNRIDVCSFSRKDIFIALATACQSPLLSIRGHLFVFDAGRALNGDGIGSDVCTGSIS